MTRAEVDKSLTPDGGKTIPFPYERYLIPNSVCGDKGEVVKVNLAFKPAGMSDAVYFLGKWVPPKPDPKDSLMRVSPRYTAHTPSRLVQVGRLFPLAGLQQDNRETSSHYFN
jgi:hypothetical protein